MLHKNKKTKEKDLIIENYRTYGCVFIAWFCKVAHLHTWFFNTIGFCRFNIFFFYWCSRYILTEVVNFPSNTGEKIGKKVKRLARALLFYSLLILSFFYSRTCHVDRGEVFHSRRRSYLIFSFHERPSTGVSVQQYKPHLILGFLADRVNELSMHVAAAQPPSKWHSFPLFFSFFLDFRVISLSLSLSFFLRRVFNSSNAFYTLGNAA